MGWGEEGGGGGERREKQQEEAEGQQAVATAASPGAQGATESAGAALPPRPHKERSALVESILRKGPGMMSNPKGSKDDPFFSGNDDLGLSESDIQNNLANRHEYMHVGIERLKLLQMVERKDYEALISALRSTGEGKAYASIQPAA